MTYSSLSWPNMFDVSRNKVNLYSNNKSITNRVKLLLLTEPTELYMEPNFGVGLRKHIFKYNNDNVIALIQDELIEQLRLWEPGVVPEQTKVERLPTNAFTADNWNATASRMNILYLKITLRTVYGDTVSFNITDADIAGLDWEATYGG